MKYKEKLDLDARPRGFGLGNKYREASRLVGFDTETVKGDAYTCQFSDSAGGRNLYQVHGDSAVIRLHFAKILQEAPPRTYVLAGAHYLRFDISVLFKDTPDVFTDLGEINHEDESGVHWRGSTNWPVIFAIARWKGRTLLLIDTFRFFMGSLENVCEDLRLPVKKLKKPTYLGQREPTAREQDAFNEYAMMDADAALEILKEIDKLWQGADVGPCISLAHQAGRIFRRNFTAHRGKVLGLDAPDPFGQAAGLEAYHGGRNSLAGMDGDTALVVDNCSFYDVRSMYPWVCSQLLPSFFRGRWVWETSQGEIVNAGIYRVSGRLLPGDVHPYRLLMDAKGNYLPPGLINGVWTTGFELNCALRHGLIESPTWSGFHWEPETRSRRHPFREFYSEVFAKKEAARGKNPVLYTYNKNLANSLTGKFVSTIPQLKWEGGNRVKYRVPGMLYNAPVGALITGSSRMILFEAEIKAKSIHAATDSIVVPPWGVQPDNVGPAMGQWEKVCEGTFVCGRNKLYAFLGPKSGSFTGTRGKGKGAKKYYQGREILKYATHAFQGTIFEFLNAVFRGRMEYRYTRMVQMKETQKRASLTALTMTEFTAQVKFGGKYGGKHHGVEEKEH